ncbi:MAG: DUF2116 family Zn-ribbon domain-containing protein [Verrucomicrobiota bacterium]
MSNREITCDGCENRFHLPEDFEDPSVLCPFCSKVVEVGEMITVGEEAPKPKLRLQKPPEKDEQRYKTCPSCGASWGIDIMICTKCGYNWGKNANQKKLMRNGWVVIVALIVVVVILALKVFS